MSRNFILNRYVTFEERRVQHFFTAYLAFVAICSVGALCNWSLSIFLVARLDVNYLFASFAGILTGTLLNFIGSSFFVFNNKKQNNVDENFEIKINELSKILSKNKVRAVLAVHFFGFPCNINKLASICQQYHLELIEDCAHNFLSQFNEKEIGSKGRAAIYSLIFVLFA